MLELLIAILYLAIGFIFFVIDMNFGSVILYKGAFDDGGFGLWFVIYITVWPILLIYICVYFIIKFLKNIWKKLI
jgi:hypothetical protein